MSRLLYVGQQVADDLKNKVSENIVRYREGNFLDFEAAGDWRISLSFDADLARLHALESDGGSESEIKNSLLVGEVLSKLTPTLARENRIWIRLSHIECLEYSRKRWLQADMIWLRLCRNISLLPHLRLAATITPYPVSGGTTVLPGNSCRKPRIAP